MSELAVIRPDDWDLPLFLHILGAMVLVGALSLSAVSLLSAGRSGSAALGRLGYMSLFYGALPAYIVFRVASEWILDKENLADADLAWIDIGYMISDMGALLLIVALVIGGIAVRRMNRGAQPSATSARIVLALVTIVLIGYLFGIWAMTTKPT
jgi:heme A synthase